MSLLLDTCAVLWLAGDAARLSNAARERVSDPLEEVFVSAITAAELACLVRKEKIGLPVHWRRWFRDSAATNGWTVLPVELEILEEAYCLPGEFHPDPADRVIVATARLNRLTVVTGDALLLDYPHVETLS
jgi:PIN domain nuclease of toxin-antitoxin system